MSVGLNPHLIETSPQMREANQRSFIDMQLGRLERQAAIIRAHQLATATQTTASTSYVAFGDGPEVTLRVPEHPGAGGEGLIQVTAEMEANGGNTQHAFAKLYEAGVAVSAVALLDITLVGAGTWVYGISAKPLMLSATPGIHTYELRFASGSGLSMSFRNRALIVEAY